MRPLTSFRSDVLPAAVFTIPVVEQGRAALEAINKVRGNSSHMGCGAVRRVLPLAAHSAKAYAPEEIPQNCYAGNGSGV
jgi:hypothetical protein